MDTQDNQLFDELSSAVEDAQCTCILATRRCQRKKAVGTAVTHSLTILEGDFNTVNYGPLKHLTENNI